MVSRHLSSSPVSRFSLPRLTTSGKIFLLLTGLLSAIGLFFVFEASVPEALSISGDQYYFVKHQVLHFVLGGVALLAAYLVPTQYLKKIAPVCYGLGIFTLILVLIPGIRQQVNGAYRWLYLGGFNFQPIELMKLGLILFFSTWLNKHQRIAPFLVLTAIPALLVMLQPDLGSVLILLAIAASIFFTAGGQIKPFLGLGAVGMVLLSLAIILSPYRRDRLTTFFNPESDPLGSSFHIHQIVIALGNGGIFGQGIGNSQQKYSYLPEASTDSIFAIVGEEVGFVGTLVILALFLGFFATGYHIIQQSQADVFTKLVGVGALTWLVTQTILNLSAVAALVPLTGVPLPYFSYGGSSLIMILLATGLLLHLARQEA